MRKKLANQKWIHKQWDIRTSFWEPLRRRTIPVVLLVSIPQPMIWSRDAGQQIPCFDRCQLLLIWMSNIKEVHGKPRLHVSLNLLLGVWPLSLLSRIRAHEQCASHDNHEKINSWVSFSFLYEYGAPLGGPSCRRSSAITRPFHSRSLRRFWVVNL